MSGEPDAVVDSPVPATPDETAILLSLLRAAMATVLLGRKGYRMRITKRQRLPAYGVLVRVLFSADESIEVWLEAPQPGMRSGVAYLGDLAARPEKDPA